MGTLTEFDIALAALKLSVVYKTSEFVERGSLACIPNDATLLVIMQRHYFDCLYVCHPDDEERFIRAVKENTNMPVVMLEYALDLERQDFERQSAAPRNFNPDFHIAYDNESGFPCIKDGFGNKVNPTWTFGWGKK